MSRGQAESGAAQIETLEQLLARTALRDRAAFASLYQRTSPRLFGLCLRMLRERSEAEEVLQEAFISVWRRAHAFNPNLAGASTWLTTLVRNRAIDRLRQQRAQAGADPLDVEHLPDDLPGPGAHAESSEDHRRLSRCLEQLDSKSRQAVREAFFRGATYKELAMRAQVPLATMKSWIRRALMQLRACLET